MTLRQTVQSGGSRSGPATSNTPPSHSPLPRAPHDPICIGGRRWPFEAALPEGARVEGAILVDQTRSIDFVARHARFIGHAPDHVLEAVLARLSDILLPMPGTP